MEYLEQANELNDQQKARILNAAAFYVRQQIINSYKKYTAVGTTLENSALYVNLTRALAITAKNVPNEDDLIDMYGPLATFMQTAVFKNSDSRQGFNPKHIYDFDGYDVCEDICDLIEKTSQYRVKSITVENAKLAKDKALKTPASQTKINASLEGSITAAATAPSVIKTREVPLSGTMNFAVMDYNTLSGNLYHGIVATLNSHDIIAKHRLQSSQTISSTKLKELALEQKNKDRPNQVQFLITTMECLEQAKDLDDESKTRILKAAAYYVREQIRVSYKGYFGSKLESSTLYTNINQAINLTATMRIPKNDLIDMYGSLATFMQKVTFKNGDSRQGFNHHQAYELNGYDPCKDICDLIKKANEYRTLSIDEEHAKIGKSKTPKSTTSKAKESRFSLWGTPAAAPTSKHQATPVF